MTEESEVIVCADTPLSPADRAREILGLGWHVEGVTEEMTFDKFELVSAISRAIAEAVEAEREACADYLMEQAKALAERAHSGTPVRGEMLAAAGLLENLSGDFRSRSQS